MPDSRRVCGGTRKNGQPCQKSAGWGTDHPGYGHCKLHFGRTANHTKAAQKLMAADAVVTFGLPVEVDPHTALLEEVHRTAGHVAWLQSKVAELDTDALVWGTVEEVERASGEWAGTDVKSRAGTNVWLSLYQRERQHLTKVAAAAITAGVAERQVRLAEQQGQLIAQVLRGVLADLGVADHPQAPAVVRQHLQLVAGGTS